MSSTGHAPTSGSPSEDDTTRLDVRPTRAMRRAIDTWRLKQTDPPSRAEAGRLLIERGLEAEGIKVENPSP